MRFSVGCQRGFSPTSQVQRARHPVAPFEYWKRARLLGEGRPWRVIQEGDRAVVLSERPPRGFVPVLLSRSEGVWQVDLAETWKNLFFGGQGNDFVKNRANPYAFGLSDLAAGIRAAPRSRVPSVLCSRPRMALGGAMDDPGPG